MPRRVYSSLAFPSIGSCRRHVLAHHSSPCLPRLIAWLILRHQKAAQGMTIAYKMTKHPQTGHFEKAAWIDVGRCVYVVFPDGRWYHEQYGVWQLQKEDIVIEATPVLPKTA